MSTTPERLRMNNFVFHQGNRSEAASEREREKKRSNIPNDFHSNYISVHPRRSNIYTIYLFIYYIYIYREYLRIYLIFWCAEK